MLARVLTLDVRFRISNLLSGRSAPGPTSDFFYHLDKCLPLADYREALNGHHWVVS